MAEIMRRHLILPLTISALMLLWTACSSDSGHPFTIESDRVRQGDYLAKALSTTALESNYPVTSNTIRQPILYKLSINGQDNEAGFGQNHYLNIPPGITQFYAPTIHFGQTDFVPKFIEPPINDNIEVHFRVDFRSVLKAWANTGVFISTTGDSIKQTDFTGLFLAGGTPPLTWLWDQTKLPESMRFQDEDGDSIYTVAVQFSAGESKPVTRRWELTQNLPGLPRFHSPSAPILEALYNLALEEAQLDIRSDSTFMAGKEWPGVWTRDMSYAIDLGLNFAFPEIAKRSLMAKIDTSGRIIQDTGTGGSWPVSTDRIVWALAGWSTFLATGDSAWLAQIEEPILEALVRDFNWNRSQKSLLFKGETSFKDWRSQTYPFWMSPAEIGGSQALSTNVLFQRAMQLAAFMARPGTTGGMVWSQRAHIYHDLIWNSFRNTLSNALTDYYLPYPSFLPAPTRDALGEALAILFSPDTTDFMRNLIATYPRTAFGTPVIAPQLPDREPYHNQAIWHFVEAYQLLAAKKVGNQAVYRHGVESITRAAALFLTNKENMVYDTGSSVGTAVNSDRQLWSVAAYLGSIYRGLIGINVMYIDPQAGFGLELKPNNPWKWSTFQLTDFVVQGSRFDISLKGTGSVVKEMRVNGRVWDPVDLIPLKIPKNYKIIITLTEDRSETDEVNLKGAGLEIPATPVCSIHDDTLTWVSSTHQIFAALNSTIFDTISQSPWIVPDSLSGYLSFMAMDSNGQISFPTPPFMRGPSVVVKLTNGKQNGSVDLDQHSPRYTINFKMTRGGDYAIRFLYANGEGPIETDNKCGVALMSVNTDEPQFLWSFPQLGSWDSWGYTEWQPVTLISGVNELTFDMKKWPIRNMNGVVNHFRLADMEIMPDAYGGN